MVLILLGLVVLTGLVGHNLSSRVKENLVVTMLLDQDMTDNEAQQIQKKLRSRPYVNHMQYVSKEQALKEGMKELGSDPTEFVGDNSKVAHIAELTEYPDGYAYDHIAIQSEEEPYGLTVYLKRGADASPDASFDACAETAFSLIGNLSELEYADAQTEEVIASFTR